MQDKGVGSIGSFAVTNVTVLAGQVPGESSGIFSGLRDKERGSSLQKTHVRELHKIQTDETCFHRRGVLDRLHRSVDSGWALCLWLLRSTVPSDPAQSCAVVPYRGEPQPSATASGLHPCARENRTDCEQVGADRPHLTRRGRRRPHPFGSSSRSRAPGLSQLRFSRGPPVR